MTLPGSDLWDGEFNGMVRRRPDSAAGFIDNATLQARHSPIMSLLHLESGDAVGDARSTVLAQGHQREESASVQEAKANNPSSRNQRSLQSEYV
jgi:hypothetical protein